MSLLEMIPTPAPLPMNTEQEQHHADKNYKAVVAAAVEACADDTQGQTCYICTEAVHWKTKDGLVRGCACRGTAGFAHVSCLAEQAKILFAEAEENHLGVEAQNARWVRWVECSLCEQRYHGVVSCALGWACWKAYVGRPETDQPLSMAMTMLGNGLFVAGHHEDALSVEETRLSMLQRLDVPDLIMLMTQGNLAVTYTKVGQREKALQMYRDVYSGYLRLKGEEYDQTIISANNYASALFNAKRFEESKSLLRKTLPVARRVLGENHNLILRMTAMYAKALYEDGAKLDDLREAVTTLEDTKQIARRVFGAAHPLVTELERDLKLSRVALGARVAGAVAAMTSGDPLLEMLPGDLAALEFLE